MVALLQILEFVGPNKAVQLFGVKLVGVNADNGHKLLFTIAFVILLALLSKVLKMLAAIILTNRHENYRFWTRQAIQVFSAALLLVGVISIWFDDPTRLATGLGLVTAGLAFALQRVVTAIAGYFIILRGNTFSVGDRIVMGGVRGDVIALTFTQTTIMEMGQPPAVQDAPPSMWVRARQYTGRMVTVSNARIFDEPVYNYSRDFPFLWEELALGIAFDDDHEKAEHILLEAACKHSVQTTELSAEVLAEMQRRYLMEQASTEPRVFWRLTDNWVELTVRFVTREHGARDIKDKMSRDILKALREADIGIASTTFELVGLPPLKIEREPVKQT